MSTPALRDRVATMVSTATDGEVTAEEILAGGGSLAALGVGSLAVLRLVDALDDELGVQLDLDAPGTFDDFDDLVRTVQERAVRDD
jgi:acyl carrier protein